LALAARQYLPMDQAKEPSKSGATIPYFEFDLVSGETNTRRFICYAALFVGLWLWKVSLRKDLAWLLRLLGTLSLLAGVGGFCRTRVEVDGAAATVHLRSRLFERWTIWRRRFAFSEFKNLILYCDIETGTARIFLRRNYSRKLVLRYGPSEGDCLWIARRLSEVLKLPIERVQE
jgi:hypothetical protein